MARLSLQVKNVASLCLALGTSVATGVAAKRFFDTPNKPWLWFAVTGLLFLSGQIVLLLVIESKEEEELSLFRRERMEQQRHSILENERLSIRIQHEIESGSPEAAERWQEFRRKNYGK